MAKQPTSLSAAESSLGKAALAVLDPMLDEAGFTIASDAFHAEMRRLDHWLVPPAWAREILLASGLFDEEAIEQILADGIEQEDGTIAVTLLRLVNPAIPWSTFDVIWRTGVTRAGTMVLWNNAMAPCWMMEDPRKLIHLTFSGETALMMRGTSSSPMLNEGWRFLQGELLSILKNYPQLDDLLISVKKLDEKSSLSRSLRRYQAPNGRDILMDAREILQELRSQLTQGGGESEISALAICISMAQSFRAWLGVPPYRSLYERML